MNSDSEFHIHYKFLALSLCPEKVTKSWSMVMNLRKRYYQIEQGNLISYVCFLKLLDIRVLYRVISFHDNIQNNRLLLRDVHILCLAIINLTRTSLVSELSIGGFHLQYRNY